MSKWFEFGCKLINSDAIDCIDWSDKDENCLIILLRNGTTITVVYKDGDEASDYFNDIRTTLSPLQYDSGNGKTLVAFDK